MSTPARSAAHAMSTGSGRIASVTALPAGSAVASKVGSCASTVVSPRSTVILLLAPRNVTAITVPVIGPDWLTVTASGRTSTVAWPSGVAGSASGSTQPRTLTDPPVTVPASRLVRPTNSATNEVAG